MELRHRRTHQALREAARRYFTAEELATVETVRGELVVHDARFRLGGEGLVVSEPPDDEALRSLLARIDDEEAATREAVGFLQARRLVPREQVERLADELVATYRPRTLLDVGCATGELVHALEQREVGGAAGIDACAWAVERRVTPAVKRGSVLDLPFRDRNFDVVFGRDVLDQLHPDDVPQALSEQARVTRPGGKIVVAVRSGTAWWTGVLASIGGLEITREPAEGTGLLPACVELTRR